MGSQSDWETMKNAADTLEALEITYDARIISAHRTPDRLVSFAKGARDEGFKVIIAGAGGAAHLAGHGCRDDALAGLRRAGAVARACPARTVFFPSCRCRQAFPSAHSRSARPARSMPPFLPPPSKRSATTRSPSGWTLARRQSAAVAEYPMDDLLTAKTIGIIGGGQLGRMLAMAAARLNFRTIILEPQADCPAAQVANDQIVAALLTIPAALAELAKRCDVITYEFENVPVAAAEKLASNVAVYPPPKALEMAQDRLTEKRFINDCGIPTARFHAVDSQGRSRIGACRFRWTRCAQDPSSRL